MIREVWSGGQTGADQGGLHAALDLGLKTGGWMPKGFRTEEGPMPGFRYQFGIRETVSPQYPQRTRKNVMETDGTILFMREGRTSPGTRITKRYCQENGKPFYEVTFARGELRHMGYIGRNKRAWSSYWVSTTPEAIAEWIIENEIRRLNVAGSRESKVPGIFLATKDTLKAAFILT